MKKIKISKIFLILVVSVMLLSACGNNNESLEGYGNNVSDVFGNLPAAEYDDEIFFSVNNYLTTLMYKLDKNSHKVRLLCTNPACRHDTVSCISYQDCRRIQNYNGFFYFTDLTGLGQNTLILKSDGRQSLMLKQVGNSEETRTPLLYDNYIYYLEYSENSVMGEVVTHEDDGENIYTEGEEIKHNIVKEDLNGNKEVIKIDEFIDGWPIPYDDIILYTNDKGQLLSVNQNNNEKSLLVDGYVGSKLIYNGYIYYSYTKSGEEGLYSMTLEGKDKTLIHSGKGWISAINEPYIYWTDSSEKIYVMDMNGENVKKISDELLSIAVFDNWDKILAVSESDDDGIVKVIIMDKDGSNAEILKMPIIITN